MATAMARVFLSPVLRKVTECAGLAGLDTWVDDIGADFEDKKTQKRCGETGFGGLQTFS